MLVGMYRAILVLVVLTTAPAVAPRDVIDEYYVPHHTLYLQSPPYDSEEEYIRHIPPMGARYRREEDGAQGRLVVETDSLVDTKFKASKRNGDLINMILGLPKDMYEAGR